MTNRAWRRARPRVSRAALPRTLLPAVTALALLPVCGLPAQAAAGMVTISATAGADGRAPDAAATRAGEWWLSALDVPAAWRAAPGRGRGITVAVLSTGVDAGQPDLTGRVTTGPDLSQTGRKPGDEYWGAEGTAVASLIAGHGHGAGQAAGVTGVAPNATILSVEVNLEYNDPLNSDAAVTSRLRTAIARGIRYAVAHRAAVIALPLDPGTLGPALTGDPAVAGGSAAERDAVRYALAHGVVLIAPAGDNGASTDAVNYPAAYPGVIAVGATSRDGQLSPFTNVGSYVALTAPGAGGTPLAPETEADPLDPAAGLLVAAPGGGYQTLASTDMSAALTAGVAALMLGRDPRLTVGQVTRALEAGATVPPDGRAGPGPAAAAEPGWGQGALDAATALTAAAAIAAAGPTPAPTPTPVNSKPAPPAQATVPAQATGPSTGGASASAAPVSAGQRTAGGGGDPGTRVRSILLDLVVGAGALIAALAIALALVGLRRRVRSGRTARAVPAALARHARTPPPAPSPAPPPAARPGLAVSVGPRRLRPWTPSAAADRRPPADKPLAPWERSPDEFATAPYLAAPDEPPRPGSGSGPMYIWNPPD